MLRSKCCKRDAHPKKPVGFESNPNLRVKNTIKRIVNGRFVLTLMTFVTIFALIGVSSNIKLSPKFKFVGVTILIANHFYRTMSD